MVSLFFVALGAYSDMSCDWGTAALTDFQGPKLPLSLQPVLFARCRRNLGSRLSCPHWSSRFNAWKKPVISHLLFSCTLCQSSGNGFKTEDSQCRKIASKIHDTGCARKYARLLLGPIRVGLGWNPSCHCARPHFFFPFLLPGLLARPYFPEQIHTRPERVIWLSHHFHWVQRIWAFCRLTGLIGLVEVKTLLTASCSGIATPERGGHSQIWASTSRAGLTCSNLNTLSRLSRLVSEANQWQCPKISTVYASVNAGAILEYVPCKAGKEPQLYLSWSLAAASPQREHGLWSQQPLPGGIRALKAISS